MLEILFSKVSVGSETALLVIAIFVASLATFLTRFLPYVLLRGKNESEWLKFIEKNSGLFIMVILIFYALQNTKFSVYPYGVPEILGVIAAFLLQIWRKNALLSIAGATILYMVLIRVV
ncbi:MAG: branched-chain amino acid ABC transporter [Campylobacteraceae bacterium]|nr:branched-chain amino acid ABC transporter [Campylobacteraceae bacterium]